VENEVYRTDVLSRRIASYLLDLYVLCVYVPGSDCGVLLGVLDGPVSYNSQAELSMKIFSPFAGFLCVVAAFLLILLFVGVVSETGETHRTLFTIKMVAIYKK